MSKDDKKKEEEKKDLTGILELSSLMPAQSAEELLSEDPFAVNVVQPVEQIDHFDSIDQIGMLDHVAPVTLFEPAPTAELVVDPFADLGTTTATAHADTTEPVFRDPAPTLPSLMAEGILPHSPPGDTLSAPLENVKRYSERARETSLTSSLKSPYHLFIQGGFGPFARDKLLHFITDNPIGLNSRDLDLQIKNGRVLLPRISEFAAIKLVQDLRDSELSFQLTPSSRDEDEVLPEDESLRVEYDAKKSEDPAQTLLILPEENLDTKLWKAFDQIHLVQFLKAEIIEVERSDLFQDLLTRMTDSLKRKARLKGASAITALTHELKPLRLPSQYQLELRATLLKK